MIPLHPPYAPMEATLVRALPKGAGFQFEPKWDGFRCLLFKDGDDVSLQSKSGQPLARYFPEIVAAARDLPKRCVLDGELVIPRAGGTPLDFDFELLLQRMHPAESRVRRLSKETPAMLFVFDFLVDARGRSLVDLPLADRRDRLERFAAASMDPRSAIRLSPATTDRKVAEQWSRTLRGHGFDGIMAKRLASPYLSGDRSAMQKVKWIRTADCVVGGFRYGQHEKLVGSLLLGLYDDEGLLHHVGFCATIKAADKPALTKKLERLIADPPQAGRVSSTPPGFTGGELPGAPSRWSRGRSTEWEPLSPKLVVEVEYGHFTRDDEGAGKFRHGTKLLRFRPEKSPRACTFDQLGVPLHPRAQLQLAAVR